MVGLWILMTLLRILGGNTWPWEADFWLLHVGLFQRSCATQPGRSSTERTWGPWRGVAQTRSSPRVYFEPRKPGKSTRRVKNLFQDCRKVRHRDLRVQWGSEYRTSLWYSNGWKEVWCQMVWFWIAIWLLDSPLIWIPEKWTPPCFLLYWYGIQMVGLILRI